MASYFVASTGQPETTPSVHDRHRCPPGRFPQGEAEYLGEFGDVQQALSLARLRFPQASPCVCCAPATPAQPADALSTGART